MLIVTHNNSIRNMVHKVIRMKDGQISKEYYNETRVPAMELEEIKKLYLDGNFYVIAVGAAVCIPLAQKCMDLIYPIMVSNVNCGMKIVVFAPTFVQLTDKKTGIRMKRLKLTGFKTYHKWDAEQLSSSCKFLQKLRKGAQSAQTFDYS